MSEYFNENRGGYGAFVKAGIGRRSADRVAHEKKIHMLFSILGFIAGLVGAYVAYDRTSSIALPIFVFLVAQFFVGRGLGDLVTDDQKVKRFIYFALPVVLMSGVLYVTYQWWGLMWLSVILGFILGSVLWALVGAILLSDIAQEEAEDSQHRLEELGQ